MLYVFHVDAGLMTTYNMSLTLESVSSLKLAIERKMKIPASSLVLLVSGGEVLQSDHMVSSYSAGTDTNPIYMFSKPSVKDSSFKQSTPYSVPGLTPIEELSTEQWRSANHSGTDIKSVAELQQAVEMCYTLPANVQTVVTCSALAQQFSELAQDISRCCEQLVHDQHLQHQGWSAVVANLEDIFTEFCERSKNFKESFKKHRLKKDFYHDQLKALDKVLQSLGQIPILPALRHNAEAHRFSAFDIFEDTATEFHGQCDRIGAPFDSAEQKTAQDFGVEAFKLSGDDVFDPVNAETEKICGESSEEATGRLEDSDEGVTFDAPMQSKEPTLLHWILAQGNEASLQDILDYCEKALSLIDADPLKEREAELCHILEYANMHGLKQIKGIEDRLYGLDQLLSDVKKLERDQHDQAQSLIQNRERVTTGCDPSVLPTLVLSHRCQLEKLLKNHQDLVDIKRRIYKSKEELSHILKARLEAVLKIENSMSVQDAHQMLSFQCFNRLARYFDIVEQLHRAPTIFVHAVNEVARRRKFSDAFLKWATELSRIVSHIHNEEVSLREQFSSLFNNHFLISLFPGLNDIPPPFAIAPPLRFDHLLPPLSPIDVDLLNEQLPTLTQHIAQHDMDTALAFFNQRFNVINREDKDVDVQGDLESSDTNWKGNHRTDIDRIDTSTTCAPETMAVSMLTEITLSHKKAFEIEFIPSEFYIDETPESSVDWAKDIKENMDTHKLEVARLNDFIVSIIKLFKTNINLIKEELDRMKYLVVEQKNYMLQVCTDIVQAWERSDIENALKLREQTQRLTVDHELELSDLKNDLTKKDEFIQSLKQEKDELISKHNEEVQRVIEQRKTIEDTLVNAGEEIKDYQCKIVDFEAQKQKEIKEMQEKLHLDYKGEIESLRSRFRLVAITNMDRSPSESSLEKIERTDVIEINNHNAIIMQTKENAEQEKEAAIQEIKERIEKEWSDKMATELKRITDKYEAEKHVTINDVTRRLLSEKDRQLEILREKESNLVRECSKYKETIQQLTDPETNDIDAVTKTQLASLEEENASLKKQILEIKLQLEKQTADSEKKEDDSDSRSSPRRDEVKPRSRASHTPCGLLSGTLSLSSCLPGQHVLLMWDPSHDNYTVLQESSIMYFVHGDSLPALDLTINVKKESDRKLYTIATVESKEYCFAKKNGNRFHMPRSSRFYRVRVKPYRQIAQPPCCDHKHKSDCLNAGALAVLGDKRPVKKWLTYMHAPESSRYPESQSSNTASQEANKSEVAIAPLIDLDSPKSEIPNLEGADERLADNTDELDNSRMFVSTTSAITDMECSVGRVLGPDLDLPTEFTVSAVSVQARDGSVVPPDSELAEEATP